MHVTNYISLSFLSLICLSAAVPIRQPLIRRADNDTLSFDYVVIGGGTAGLAMAARLAEASLSVAVIEAGGFYEQDAGNITTIPADATYGAGASASAIIPSIDWGFMTTPQSGMNNRSLHYERGKTLGGSSARDYFTYQRPTVGSLQQWASMVGDSTYEYDDFVKYYKKGVKYTPPNNAARPANASVPAATDAFTPGAGPLQVSFPNWANTISSYVNLAWQNLGLPITNDFVSGTLYGIQYCMNTVAYIGQVRSTSYSSYLRSLPADAPIHVYNNTMAKRILFDENKNAIGVRVNSSGEEYFISARKEVILSAGAFNSPQLLMVSGVGPNETLNQFNISIVSSLPGVGQNMQDHLSASASYRVSIATHSMLGNQSYLELARSQYNANGSGILSNLGGDIIAWDQVSADTWSNLSQTARTALSSYPSDWPYFENLALDAYSGDNENYITGSPKTPYMYASPSVVNVIPQSRGNVTIASSDTSVSPVINPNWLTSPVDQELALVSFRKMRQMMDTNIMREVVIEEVLPGRNVTSDEGILNAIRSTGIQMFHASATCKMGTPDDPYAVVDSKARVFGTQRLRVVDASAFPFLPPGHPQSTVYALAEKITDEILATQNTR